MRQLKGLSGDYWKGSYRKLYLYERTAEVFNFSQLKNTEYKQDEKNDDSFIPYAEFVM